MTIPAPVPRPVPPDEGEARCTIAEWMKRGPALVRGGVSSVVITDRHPDADKDRLSLQGAFFWHYGWRWLADDMDCSACTLPAAVFVELPDCPYPEVVAERDAGHGIAPRWPTPDEATEALSLAAMRWAIKQAEAPQ